MVQIYFMGDKEELEYIKKCLFKNNVQIISALNQNENYNFLEGIEPIIFAMLGSTGLAGIIVELIKSRNSQISIEKEHDGKRIKISCPKGSKNELIDIMEAAGIISKSNKDWNFNRIKYIFFYTSEMIAYVS